MMLRTSTLTAYSPILRLVGDDFTGFTFAQSVEDKKGKFRFAVLLAIAAWRRR
jgi:hypothetical protein